MRFLLDTDIVVHASELLPSVLAKMVEHDGYLVTSALCLVEARRGLHRTQQLEALRRQRLAIVVSRISVLPFDTAAVDVYDRITARLGFSRSRDFDRMIAAHAVAVNATLVTDNLADFAGIPGLTLENWVSG